MLLLAFIGNIIALRQKKTRFSKHRISTGYRHPDGKILAQYGEQSKEMKRIYDLCIKYVKVLF